MQVMWKVLPLSQKYLFHDTVHFMKMMKNDYKFGTYMINTSGNTPVTQSCQNKNFPAIVKVAIDVGLTSEDMQYAVDQSPELLNTTPNQWNICFSLFSNFGFSYHDILGMCKNYPTILFTNEDKLTKSLLLWQNCDFGDKNLLQLLKYNPYFLFIDSRKIEKRIPLLKSITSTKRLTTLLKHCPDLMFQNWTDIQAKLDYLKDIMKIEEVEIIKSTALSYTTHELMARHVFLDRCGRFIPVKPKALPDEPNTNPKLSQITDTSDDTFATKVAGLTLEEFEVFQELFLAERQQADDSDSDTN